MIYHITSESAWRQAQSAGAYRADSLESEGFIHASTRAQVLATAARYYRGQAGLVLLCIDESRLTAELITEYSQGGDAQFPHIYGPLNLEAVLKVVLFAPQTDGTFVLPDDMV